jgi:hypothetical protein
VPICSNQDDRGSPDRDHFVFFNQANMSAGYRPRSRWSWAVASAGGAYMPAMSDESTVKTRAPSFGRAAAGRNRHRGSGQR